MASFILVHGSWHGAWCWRRLVPLLEAKGHQVWAGDLPGMGADTTPMAQVTLAGWTAFIAAQAQAMEQPVILVGHSRGGVVVSEVAESIPDEVSGIIYLTAVLAGDKETVASMLGEMSDEAVGALRFSEDGLSSTLDPAAAAALLYNTTPVEWSAFAVASLGRDAAQPNGTPVHLTRGRYGSVPRAYIECLQDRTLPIELQRRMQKSAPCDPVLTLDTDHSPFLSAPEMLVEAISEAAATMKDGRRT
jgi:pimeloyl-ACP methyl ester carboxylesterase